MKAILKHDGKILVLNLREIQPPGWFSASVEAEVDEGPVIEESKKMLALPAPEGGGSITGRFSQSEPNAVEVPKKQTVLSNLKSGIYRYLPKRPHDGHLIAEQDFKAYLRKHPLKSAVPLNQLWEKAFPNGHEQGAFRLAVAALGHGKYWMISEGRSAGNNRRIFYIGPK